MARRILLVTLLLTGCAKPETRIVTRDVLVPTPVPCITAEQRAAIEALLPGDIGPWLPDPRAREGRYVERLSQYRSFADVTKTIFEICAGHRPPSR
jgi:hypothetical protein